MPGKNNTDFTAVEAKTVHFGASLLSVLFFGKTDEPETTATTGGAVKRGVNVANLPKLCKNGTKLIRTSFVAKVVNLDGMQT